MAFDIEIIPKETDKIVVEEQKLYEKFINSLKLTEDEKDDKILNNFRFHANNTINTEILQRLSLFCEIGMNQ